MYDPNFFTLNIEQMLSGEPLDSAIGVLQVTVHSARGLKGSKIGGGTPDPYVSLLQRESDMDGDEVYSCQQLDRGTELDCLGLQ